MMKQYLRKTLALLPSLLLLALGLACYIVADMGSDPYTSFQMGVARLANISIGSVSMIANISIVVMFLFIDRSYVNIGSFIFAFGLGPLLNLFSSILFSVLPAELGLGLGITLLILGTAIVALSIAMYIPIRMGYSALDMVALKISEKLKTSYGNGLYIFYAFMMAGALMMGVQIGLGTIINIVCLGKAVDIILPLVNSTVCRMAGIEEQIESAC